MTTIENKFPARPLHVMKLPDENANNVIYMQFYCCPFDRASGARGNALLLGLAAS